MSTSRYKLGVFGKNISRTAGVQLDATKQQSQYLPNFRNFGVLLLVH